MTRIACFAAFVLLVSGCASRNSAPPQAAPATPTQLSHATPPAAAESQVELRHFYLLSPGPRATLVVTRTDTAPTPRQDP